MTTSQPQVRRSAAEQKKFHEAMRDLWEHRISFNELLGHYAYGRLHGGAISATLDALAGMALMVAMGEKHCDESAEQVMHRFGRMGTIDLRVDFLRQGIGHHFIGHA